MSEKELLLDQAYKKKKCFDQMASMHFKLNDFYNAWNVFFDVIEIIVAVCLCGITFLDFKTYFNVDSINMPFIVGIISIFLFAFTLIKQRLNFKSKAEKHYLAGKMYSGAKLDISDRLLEWEIAYNPTSICEYISTQYKSLNDLVQIPESKFHKLKHHHQNKVEFSKFLDNNKQYPYLICKCKFYFSKQKMKAKLNMG